MRRPYEGNPRLASPISAPEPPEQAYEKGFPANRSRADALDGRPTEAHAGSVIRALFFDAAGTLIDTAEPVARTYARVLGQHGYTVAPERIAERFPAAFSKAGSPDFDGMPEGDLAERIWWRAIVDSCIGQRVNEEAFDALFNHYAEPKAWRILPDVVETLEHAAFMGLRLAVVSNFDSRLHRVLAGLDLARHFECVVTSAEVGARKPSPEIFRYTMARMDLEADAVRHVGDSPTCDVEGARAAGIQPFLLKPPAIGLRRFLNEVREDLRK